MAGFLIVSMLALPPVWLQLRSIDQVFAELGRRRDYISEDVF
jgi:hypothetical protein